MPKLSEILGEHFKQIPEDIKTKYKDIDLVDSSDYVEKNKFDGINNQLSDLQIQIKERDKQLGELKIKAAGNEELTTKINELEKLNKTTKEEYETKIVALRKETSIELKLKDEKAKNLKAVKALLDLEKVSLDGENLIGLEEQLKTLKEQESYLFGSDTLKGREPNKDTNPVDPECKNNPFSKEHFNLTEQGKLLKENPELAAKLKIAIN
ncbi:Phage minor structural protein GP20 [Desulfonispora thiosulfatigenes DSM 11270]|uniref:Phage minor structural protein GP20 n=1 Tax=Desulfonispora thiosulfatigenes DSM 11270 TaxID=656914 RepID=A0A1W1VPX5_DESTI|nr:phage scaffolding protein [Desulfonispora thiosulfatigenes]SMB95408.1 Phage minor structural protein GP20 [Desulfonispora thiosulfatigenes DSM 11270]